MTLVRMHSKNLSSCVKPMATAWGYPRRVLPVNVVAWVISPFNWYPFVVTSLTEYTSKVVVIVSQPPADKSNYVPASTSILIRMPLDTPQSLEPPVIPNQALQYVRLVISVCHIKPPTCLPLVAATSLFAASPFNPSRSTGVCDQTQAQRQSHVRC